MTSNDRSDVRFIHPDEVQMTQEIAREQFEAQLEGSGLQVTPQATAQWWPLTV